MSKRALVLIVFAIVLGATCVGMRMNWWKRPEIKILPQIRPPLRNSRVAPGDVAVYPVTFAFDQKYQFTEIKVVAVDDEKTNKFPHAVWHMISDSNSIPIKAVQYGTKLRGMKPQVPRADPEALQPDVSYHLYLVAGNAKGDVKFQTHELVKPSTQ